MSFLTYPTTYWPPFKFGPGSLDKVDSWIDTKVNQFLDQPVWEETADSYEITIEAPGFTPEELDITMHQRTLIVTGNSKRKKFTETLTLPENIDRNSCMAELDAGLLTIKLTKKEPASKTHKIKISTKK